MGGTIKGKRFGSMKYCQGEDKYGYAVIHPEVIYEAPSCPVCQERYDRNFYADRFSRIENLLSMTFYEWTKERNKIKEEAEK